MTGWSAGFTFWYTGGVGIWGGSSGAALAMAACTSWAAPSMERSSENWMVMAVRPCALDDVIESMPAIVVNCFSSGVAMAEARSEEHTSELQSQSNLVCRLLLEKKKIITSRIITRI